ncbi:MAG: transaldolase family protein [Phycisphaerae bacterium]
MTVVGASSDLAGRIAEFVRRDFTPHFGERAEPFPGHPLWSRLRDLGSELWLDTGSLDDAAEVWTREFSALTTNNTLLNKEVQRGVYDALIHEAADLLAAEADLSDRDRLLELAFILNARHALRLVERFDAYVSVEEHTDLAHDVDAAVETARRYHAICPERFIIKVPLTPAGLLATRRLADEGVPVNHTLGFSARQNVVIARIARPRFVNVFLGRLGSFVKTNGLGGGEYVGQRSTLASQRVVRALREEGKTPSRQIAASFRAGPQVQDLAGVDVLTMPPKVAREFLDLGLGPDDLDNRTTGRPEPPLAEAVDPTDIGLPVLWEVDERLLACLDALEQEDLRAFTPGDLVRFFADHGCGDVLVDWTDEQVATSAAEGKIPTLANWRDALTAGEVGLDALMNLAGLGAFAADQKAMDTHVAEVLKA